MSEKRYLQGVWHGVRNHLRMSDKIVMQVSGICIQRCQLVGNCFHHLCTTDAHIFAASKSFPCQHASATDGRSLKSDGLQQRGRI